MPICIDNTFIDHQFWMRTNMGYAEAAYKAISYYTCMHVFLYLSMRFHLVYMEFRLIAP